MCSRGFFLLEWLHKCEMRPKYYVGVKNMDNFILGVEPHNQREFKSYIFHNRNFSNKELLAQVEELNKNKDDRNFASRLMFEMYNSNKIEGNTLTNQDTKLILKDKIIPNDVSYQDLMECINLNITIEKYRKIKDLSMDLILDIHAELTADLNDEDKGRIRTEPVHFAPSHNRVKELLSESINKFNISNRNLIDIFIFKLEFVSIHPFRDGNGKISRIIMNGLLENLGYPRLIITDRNKNYYYKALEDAQVGYLYDNWIRYCLLLMKFNLEYINDIDILV